MSGSTKQQDHNNRAAAASIASYFPVIVELDGDPQVQQHPVAQARVED